MRRIFVLALTALALVGVMTPDAFAQAPTPKFTISGLIDQVGTYAANYSASDGNLGRNSDKQFYGRTRGRFDFIGEVGKAKGVLGIEIDSYYGQTGFGDSNGTGSTVCVTNTGSSVTCAAVGSGSESSFDLNTDTQSNLQVKWLYTEFEVPLIPVPTVARLGAQPFGAAANYKLATYANGDFGGVNIVSTITPNIKLLFTYVGVEENLTGKKDIGPVALGVGVAGTTAPQSRGDDFALIFSAEVTPTKGVDLKPMFSYFYANGVTAGSSRFARGGYSVATGVAGGAALGSPFAPTTVSGADGVGTGIGENRYTVGLDARLRFGAFSIDPTVLYQFGNRTSYNTVSSAYGVLCNTSGTAALNCAKDKASINAWLIDVRPAYQLGPLLLEGLVMWTSGSSAKDNLRNKVNFYQPLDTDSSYLNGWGTQITGLGVDYYQGLSNGVTFIGNAIGYDKYGRIELGARGTYALTPALSFFAAGAILWTDKKVDTDGTVGAGGLLPAFVDPKTGRSARPEGDSNYLGTEIDAGMTWRFAPGLAFDVAAGYLFAGAAYGHRYVAVPYCSNGVTTGCAPQGPKDQKVNDVFISTARVRFTF